MSKLDLGILMVSLRRFLRLTSNSLTARLSGFVALQQWRIFVILPPFLLESPIPGLGSLSGPFFPGVKSSTPHCSFLIFLSSRTPSFSTRP